MTKTLEWCQFPVDGMVVSAYSGNLSGIDMRWVVFEVGEYWQLGVDTARWSEFFAN